MHSIVSMEQATDSKLPRTTRQVVTNSLSVNDNPILHVSDAASGLDSQPKMATQSSRLGNPETLAPGVNADPEAAAHYRRVQTMIPSAPALLPLRQRTRGYRFRVLPGTTISEKLARLLGDSQACCFPRHVKHLPCIVLRSAP